ncbi:MAG TPA: AcvB/VirJ family lysyl-phosphatidylglycerol hydrolase [Chitinophagaceae bacterium]|nr:AcvB/VirJ family lysyl-phosphatidylglycerol hydrolase [Chitinophagaceae bacterium]
MKNFILTEITTLLVLIATAKNNKLPVEEWISSDQTPFVLYISGDGGLNSFSTRICKSINQHGYSITAVNAKTYFWDKKTPDESASDLGNYLEKQMTGRKNQQIVLAGYSFGADVLPFIANRLPDSLKKKIIHIFLLSPSTSTDFEIHWLDIFGGKKKRSMNVVAEVNKINTIKTTAIFGTTETDFPVNDIHLKNFSHEYLSGGHHFDENTTALVKTMSKYLK